MKQLLCFTALAGFMLFGGGAFAGQAPYGAKSDDIPLSGHDRVYAAEQYSNTVSVQGCSNDGQDTPRISTRKQHKQARSTELVETILEAAVQVLAQEGAQRFTTAG